MARTIRVLSIQPALRWQQAMPNMHLLRQCIEKQQAIAPADLLVLPEVFNGVLSDDDPLAGPMARQFLGTLARTCGIAVIGGSIDLLHEDGTRRNRCFVLDRDGQELGCYDKQVLFAAEQGTRTPGSGPGLFEIAGARVGVLICADLWNATCVRELAALNPDLICVPVKTTVPTQSHVDYARQLWWNLTLTRAMEFGVPIVISDWGEARHESTALADGQRVKSVHYTSGGASITDPSKRPDFAHLQVRYAPAEAGIRHVMLDLDACAAYRDYRRSVGLLT